MIKSWHIRLRPFTTALAVTLAAGLGDAARADPGPSIDVQISSPGFYTRFATGPQWRFYPYYPLPPVYVPLYPVYPVYRPVRYWQPLPAWGWGGHDDHRGMRWDGDSRWRGDDRHDGWGGHGGKGGDHDGKGGHGRDHDHHGR